MRIPGIPQEPSPKPLELNLNETIIQEQVSEVKNINDLCRLLENATRVELSDQEIETGENMARYVDEFFQKATREISLSDTEDFLATIDKLDTIAADAGVTRREGVRNKAIELALKPYQELAVRTTLSPGRLVMLLRQFETVHASLTETQPDYTKSEKQLYDFFDLIEADKFKGKSDEVIFASLEEFAKEAGITDELKVKSTLIKLVAQRLKSGSEMFNDDDLQSLEENIEVVVNENLDRLMRNEQENELTMGKTAIMEKGKRIPTGGRIGYIDRHSGMIVTFLFDSELANTDAKNDVAQFTLYTRADTHNIYKVVFDGAHADPAAMLALQKAVDKFNAR